MAVDAMTMAGKQYAELLQEYHKLHTELQQATNLLQSIASGETDAKRLKSVPGGIQLMPEQPPTPAENGKGKESVPAKQSAKAKA